MKITSLALYLMNLIKQTEKTLFDRSIRMIVPEIPGLIGCPLFDCFKKICEPIRAVAWGDHLLYGGWSAMRYDIIDLPINRFQIFLREYQFAFGG
jgi:hypothetical protein